MSHGRPREALGGARASRTTKLKIGATCHVRVPWVCTLAASDIHVCMCAVCCGICDYQQALRYTAPKPCEYFESQLLKRRTIIHRMAGRRRPACYIIMCGGRGPSPARPPSAIRHPAPRSLASDSTRRRVACSYSPLGSRDLGAVSPTPLASARLSTNALIRHHPSFHRQHLTSSLPLLASFRTESFLGKRP
jgi:hypothetical protein